VTADRPQPGDRDDRTERAGLGRRQFLSLAGGAGALGLLAACSSSTKSGATSQPGSSTSSTSGPISTSSSTVAPTSSVAPSTTLDPVAAAAAAKDHVLVVVQLGGGNDGLNTLVPLDGRYHDSRPTLGLSDDSLVAIPGNTAYGLHPSLAPLSALLAAGRIAALEAIGYDHPNRSHFAALDDWWSATPGRSSTTGWLGRWMDATAGSGDDPLRAVALGTGVPALTGATTLPAVIVSPAAFDFRLPKRADPQLIAQLATLVGGEDPLMTSYRTAISRAASAVDMFGALTGNAADAAGTTDDPNGGEITQSLLTAARLLTQHPATRVIHIAAGGFDTHADQLETQKALLEDLATGVSRFFEDVTTAGQTQRVLLMTVSEFGRRVQENGSGGTDHGKAGVQFVVGPSVSGGVYGKADLTKLDDGDLAPDIDVRSLYTMALDWLGGPVDEIIGQRYDTLGVVRS
jgi:uncharacterized protein (DUF1501 family)